MTATMRLVKTLPLEEALVRFVTSKGLTFGGMERRAWNEIRVVFGRGADFFFVDTAAAPDKTLYANVDALDDALYDATVAEISATARSRYGIG
jgi:hypothetical protein